MRESLHPQDSLQEGAGRAQSPPSAHGRERSLCKVTVRSQQEDVGLGLASPMTVQGRRTERGQEVPRQSSEWRSQGGSQNRLWASSALTG